MTTAAPVVRTLGSAALTRGFKVTVQPQYVPEQSDPDNRRFVFEYQIHVRNVDGKPATLRSRRWHIVDEQGRVNEVQGEGVVGRQPHLSAGQTFIYKSFCPLATPWGTMEGTYFMEADDGETFEVAVGRFFLVAPTERTPLPA